MRNSHELALYDSIQFKCVRFHQYGLTHKHCGGYHGKFRASVFLPLFLRKKMTKDKFWREWACGTFLWQIFSPNWFHWQVDLMFKRVRTFMSRITQRGRNEHDPTVCVGSLPSPASSHTQRRNMIIHSTYTMVLKTFVRPVWLKPDRQSQSLLECDIERSIYIMLRVSPWECSYNCCCSWSKEKLFLGHLDAQRTEEFAIRGFLQQPTRF